MQQRLQLIYRFWGVYWSDWESDVLCGPYQTIQEAFVDDFGSPGAGHRFYNDAAGLGVVA